MKFIPVLTTLGYMSRRVDETELFDTSLIREVHPGPPHYERGVVSASPESRKRTICD
jgi:hypothetical protein